MYKNNRNDQRQKIQTPSGNIIQGYSTNEIEKIKIALNKKLGPEFISKRKGPGYNSVQYLEGWKAINLANEIFGPNGWSTELKEFKVDYIDDNKHGSISIGLSCVVRVILKDGTFHEDVGYGSIENCKSKSMAFDKCKKEAFTDGMKRALRQFGNALGNCLYDKEFLQQITKVSSEPVKFDASSLMRRSTTLPKLETKTEIDSIKSNPRVSINNNNNNTNNNTNNNKERNNDKRPETLNINRNNNGDNNDEDNIKIKEDVEDSFIFSDDWPEDDDEEVNEKILNSNNFNRNNENLSEFEIENEELIQEEIRGEIQGESTETSVINKNDNGVENISTIPEHVTFVSATSADTIQQDPSLQKSLQYDVSYSSSQINKSSFINHSKSLPVKKSQIKKDSKIKNINNENINKVTNIKTNNTNKSNITSNNLTLNPNPIIKRSFGLPPNKLPNKRLKR